MQSLSVKLNSKRSNKTRNLEHKRSCSWREVEVLGDVRFRVIFRQETLNYDRLSSSLLSDQQHGLKHTSRERKKWHINEQCWWKLIVLYDWTAFPHLALLADGLYKEVCANVVHVGHQDGAVIWCWVWGINILLYARAPVDPLTWKYKPLE